MFQYVSNKQRLAAQVYQGMKIRRATTSYSTRTSASFRLRMRETLSAPIETP